MANTHVARILDVLFLKFHCTLLYLGFGAFSGMFLVNGGSHPAETDPLEGSKFCITSYNAKVPLETSFAKICTFEHP